MNNVLFFVYCIDSQVCLKPILTAVRFIFRMILRTKTNKKQKKLNILKKSDSSESYERALMSVNKAPAFKNSKSGLRCAMEEPMFKRVCL